MEHSQKYTAKSTETQQQNNSESSSKELVEKIQIENTPFHAIRMDDKWFLVMGKYRLSEPVQTLEEVKADAADASWFRIMQLIQIMLEEDKTKTNETLKKRQIDTLNKL
ncbi:MAG: hypothetical protein [Microviridae sp.]|nr:MAG: hypothetical protein [Microviridae sp.]